MLEGREQQASASLLDDGGCVRPGLQGFSDVSISAVVASQVHIGVDVLIPIVGLGRGDALGVGSSEPQDTTQPTVSSLRVTITKTFLTLQG